MAYDDLADFLSELESRGELHRISAPVSSRFEIAAITRETVLRSDRSPALLFDQVDGQSVPVVTNLLGTESRMLAALRVESFADLAQQMIDLIAPDIPSGWMNALQFVPRLTQLMKLPPSETQTGRSQQVVRVGRDVNLAALPVPYSWQGESGPVLTAAVAHAVDPVSEARILLRTSAELTGANRLAIHCHPGDEIHAAAQECQRRGVPLPLALSLGGDPAIAFTSQLPLPRGTDPATVAGFLRNRPMELVRARSQDVLVPAQAEFIIEGYIDPAEPTTQAGPVAAPTGYYGPVETVPCMHVTTLTHCSNPVLPATIVGPPPQEDFWAGRAIEQLSLPLVRLFVRDVAQLHWPRSGMFRNLLFVSIRKTHPQHAKQTMQALWGLHGTAQAKFIVVVDEDVDVTSEELVWYTVGVNAHPGRDTIFAEGPAGAYDHAAPHRYAGEKMGIDATVKSADEGHPRAWPERVEIPDETRQRIRQRWSEFGLPDAADSGGGT